MLVAMVDEPVDCTLADPTNAIFLNDSDHETEGASSAANGMDNEFDSNGIIFVD